MERCSRAHYIWMIRKILSGVYYSIMHISLKKKPVKKWYVQSCRCKNFSHKNKPRFLMCPPYHKFKKERKFYLLSNQSNLIFALLIIMFYDTMISLLLLEILFPLLLLPFIWTWRCPTKKLFLFGRCTQMNLMSFTLMIVYQLHCSPTYVHLCKYLI